MPKSIKPEHTNQHYVPQCYLKSWNDNNEKIWIWNKIDLSLANHTKAKKSMKKTFIQ